MYAFARSFVDPAGSPIRDLFKYLGEPGMISFAGGYPDARLFDVEGLGEAAARAYGEPLACLQYGSTDGTPPFKAEVIRLMQKRGIPAQPEQLLITTGSQQAFDLLLRVLVDDGDPVLVENPSYPTNIQAMRARGARITPVPTDGQGLDVAALARLLDGWSAGAPRPKLLYTVPTFGNPAGTTLPLARRLRLLDLAVRHRFVIVEDDPYGDLRFAGEAIPSLRALVGEVEGSSDWVVHLSSLSKIVAPGLRVGWSIGPGELARRCAIAKQGADIGSSPWTQAIAAHYLASGRLDGHLQKIRAAYGEKCRALCAGLRERLGPALSFQAPEGGMFVWAKLNDGVPAADLLREAIARKVMFVPGTGFHAGEADPSTLRLSFTAPSVADIGLGVQRIVQAWQALRSPWEIER